MKIGLGADPFGLELKEAVKQHLLALGHECVDLGGTADHARPYYEVAHDLAKKVGSGELERGILTCGIGLGMTIVANKHRNVCAAVCEDPSAAGGPFDQQR